MVAMRSTSDVRALAPVDVAAPTEPGDRIGPGVGEVAIGAAGKIPEVMQFQQDAKEPHQRELGEIFVQFATGRRHPRSAVADEFKIVAAAAELADQVGSVQVAAGLAD